MLLFSVQFNMVPSAENEIIISFIQHIFPVVNVRVYCRVISGRAIGLLPRSLYIVAVTETLERQKKKNSWICKLRMQQAWNPEADERRQLFNIPITKDLSIRVVANWTFTVLSLSLRRIARVRSLAEI